MKWFYSWLAKKCKQVLEEENRIGKQPMEAAIPVSKGARRLDSNNYGLSFTVYRANGGHIIETRTYDRKHDSSDHNLHIVTDDKDLGEEIGKIITIENLRV